MTEIGQSSRSPELQISFTNYMAPHRQKLFMSCLGKKASTIPTPIWKGNFFITTYLQNIC